MAAAALGGECWHICAAHMVWRCMLPPLPSSSNGSECMCVRFASLGHCTAIENINLTI